MERHLPKKITELGRIRIGAQEKNSSGKGTHPHKLDTFRLTSSNKPLLHFAANLYGGTVREWTGDRAPEGQYELYTTVNAMDVLIPTASAVSVQYEEWTAGGCTKRCDGQYITHCPLNEALIGAACQCPEDDRERAELAADGKACGRICRLNVLLPDLPGMGTWRLDTKGHHATAELLGSLELLGMAQHQIIEATLRLEQRSVKRWVKDKDGKRRQQSTTLKFCVPVLWPKYTPRQMFAAADQSVLLMEPPKQLAPPVSATIALFGDRRNDMTLSHDASMAVPHREAVENRITSIGALWKLCGKSQEEIAAWWDGLCEQYQLPAPQEFGLERLGRLRDFVQHKVDQLLPEVQAEVVPEEDAIPFSEKEG